jgi:hypothetical protein
MAYYAGGETSVYFPAWVLPETTIRSAHSYRAIGRLRDGVSLEQATLEMDAIGSRLSEQSRRWQPAIFRGAAPSGWIR